MGRHAPSAAASLFGLIWLAFAGAGWKMLAPGRMRWLFVFDWGQAQLGWMFFRNDVWRFPIGRFTTLLFPVGATVGYSDSIPSFAVIAKLLSPILPWAFQYFGVWFASCFMLQGYVGAKITGLFFRDRWAQALGGALFVTSPALLHRVMHPSLCAHWLILALVYLHWRIAPDKRSARIGWALTILSATFHPYLAAMILVLTLALLVRVKMSQSRQLSWSWVLSSSASLLAALALVFWVLGYTGLRVKTAVNGFGYYAADLATFFNPMGYSRHFPSLPASPGAYEGLAYLGVGILLLAPVAIVLFAAGNARRRWRSLTPLFIACGLLFVIALSDNVRLSGREIIRADWAHVNDWSIAQTFRSTGRFVWPLHYVLMTCVLAGIGSALRRYPFGSGVLFLAIVLQIGDTNFAPAQDRFRSSLFEEPKSAVWSLARGDYDHLALFPPQIMHSECGAPFDYDYVYRLSYVAYRNGLTINSGYVSRLLPAVDERCHAAEENIGAGRFDDRTIYAPGNDVTAFDRQAVCGKLDGFRVCVTKTRATTFRDALSQL
jgi:hypothetical protein